MRRDEVIDKAMTLTTAEWDTIRRRTIRRASWQGLRSGLTFGLWRGPSDQDEIKREIDRVIAERAA